MSVRTCSKRRGKVTNGTVLGIAMILAQAPAWAGEADASATGTALRLSRQLGTSVPPDPEGTEARHRIPLPGGEINSQTIKRAGKLVERDGQPYLVPTEESKVGAGETAKAVAKDR